MALVNLLEVKLAMGIPEEETERDAQISEAIDAASQAILNYTDRDFGSANVTETRNYEYDGSGFLDIDDASSVTGVTVTNSGFTYTLNADEWEPQPYGSPIYTYILLPKGGLWGISPAMGFKQNLDTRDWFPLNPTVANVTATWGYPEVPDDVRQAAIWTVENFVTSGSSGGGYGSESIADYSYSQGGGGEEASSNYAIPNRAKELLAVYVRPFT